MDHRGKTRAVTKNAAPQQKYVLYVPHSCSLTVRIGEDKPYSALIDLGAPRSAPCATS